MSATTTPAGVTRPRPLEAITAWARDNSWSLGLVGFLALLFVFTKLIQPSYGATALQGLANSMLPLALAAVAQSIVIIAGGIDLSVASMMALTNVVAASQMRGQGEEYAVLVVIGVLVLGLVLGLVNGSLIVFTRVPDIVVTLAMLYVWAGCALLVLAAPGGSAAVWLKDLVKGSLLIEWIPKSAVLLIVIVAIVWIPLRRSRLGLSIYAIGSNRLAAFRSGVAVGRTKIVAYALGGLFAALGGLALTASMGVGRPMLGGYTLMSIAAAVLGGVSLAGGRGGVFGPIVAVMILSLLQTDITLVGVNPNLATVLQGAILIGVLMLGSITQFRRGRR
ncbi:MAG: inner-rane translocator [Chloroflexi bacterium]|nr:inner-rane translocator [Chloroflexota bacterium]